MSSPPLRTRRGDLGRRGQLVFRTITLLGRMVVMLAPAAAVWLALPSARAQSTDKVDEGTVRCANLIYGADKTSVCFSDAFLKQLGRESHIQADAKLHPVRLDAADLYQYPFAVMTGEGEYQLSPAQRESLRNYLTQGGFIIASAGCSNPRWAKSFRRELELIFPELSLQRLDPSHPIFHCLYEIQRLDLGKSSGQAYLEGLEIDGKIVLVFSRDGLNDSGKVSDDCCCCGGNEIKNARLVNCNLLAYTLTH
jgi:hypothetical protein